jgi:formate hydrogenlyase transcriptional activator
MPYRPSHPRTRAPESHHLDPKRVGREEAYTESPVLRRSNRLRYNQSYRHMLPLYRDRPSAFPPFAPPFGEPLDVLRAALEESLCGTIVASDNGAILFVNTPAAKILGGLPGELIGKPLSLVLPVAKDDQSAEFWKRPNGKASAVVERTGTLLRRDGVAVPLEVCLRAHDDGTTRHVIASITDLTDRLDLEARLAAATNAHLGFARLVADVVGRFGGIDPDHVDDAIVDGLAQVAQALQLDWTSLWRWQSGDEHIAAWRQGDASVAEPFAIASIPQVIARLQAGEPCSFTSRAELPSPDRETFGRHGIQSAVIFPAPPAGRVEGLRCALALGSTAREQTWAPAVVERLRLMAAVASQAAARRAEHDALQNALDEVRRLRERVTSENVELRREVKGLRTACPVPSDSAAIRHVLLQIDQVAKTPATVLLLGETGTGKEVMAQAIHDHSPRHQRPMIRVSCAAIPTALIESELFGRERGAYTGALSRQIGRFEAANQSTLFLDEIGDLPLEVQVKLLRVLQERVVERLGSTQPVKVDVRIIAATNRNLEDAVRDKTFREDLFYRLNVFPIVVPPLRERVEDIPSLVWSFVDEFSRLFGKTIESISKESLSQLQRYPWPGNVRELRNVIERAVIVATGRQLVVAAPRLGDRQLPMTAMTLTELEVDHIRAVLKSTGWRVRGNGGAAERLGIKPTTLESRMARLGIARQRAS